MELKKLQARVSTRRIPVGTKMTISKYTPIETHGVHQLTQLPTDYRGILKEITQKGREITYLLT